MKYPEACKLSKEYRAWCDGRLRPPDSVKTGGQFVIWVDERKSADISVRDFRDTHFDAVLAELTRMTEVGMDLLAAGHTALVDKLKTTEL